ncbi:MAG: TonB-dependent receptor [Proteobacteria bacterium]|uniref:TonB-dependent receptor n=1 Tax=Rudaea sp. TaxID=2136325 RepID=UPI00378460E4|nr:TonB-dependent receptor [Pseudomonadota bacterium]
MKKTMLAQSIHAVLHIAVCAVMTVEAGSAIAAVGSEDQTIAGDKQPPNSAAVAQNAGKPNGKAEEMSVVTVTGYAASLERAILLKQSTDQVVDAISAEDAGKFPDINLAESLQRVTGVQISRLSADGSTANEGKYISVRGLPTEFNYVSLNGSSIASASDSLINQTASRNFDFGVLAPDFISTLAVYKTPKADLTEGGVAATIDVQTITPLDLGKEVFKASFGAQQSTGLGKQTPNVSLLYSNVFADNTFGVTAGFSWNRRQYLNSTWGSAQLDPQTINDKPYYVLDSLGILQEKNTLDTKTGYGALQFRPDPGIDLTLTGLHAETHNSQIQSSFDIRPQYASAYTDLVADANNVLTTQIGQGIYYEDQTFHTWNTNKLDVLALKLQWRPGNWEIGGGLDYSRSRTASRQFGIDTLEAGVFDVGPSYNGGYRILPGDPIASFVLDPAFNVASPANYFLNYAGGNVLARADTIRAARADATYRFSSGVIEALKVGVRYQQETNSNASAFYQAFGQPGTSPGRITMEPFVSPWPLGSMLGGYDGGAFVPTNFPFIDPQRFLNYYYGGTFGGFLHNAATTVSADPTNQYSIKEKVTAAYAMAEFRFDAGVPVHGNAGVRLVRTRENVLDNTYDPNDVVLVNPPPPQGSSLPSVIYPPFAPMHFNHDYNDVLPSLNATADLRDDLFLRFAVAKMMTRPTLDAMVPRYSFSYTGPTESNSFSSGNPNLDPFKATQYDLSLEWYYAPGSMLSAAYFYKDIASFIQTRHSACTIQNIPFDCALPVNSTGGHVKGIEANYIQLFNFLPGAWSGLGAQVNATWALGLADADPIDNIPAHTFQNLSKWTANATVFWEKYDWSLRLAYNYRGPYLADPNVRGQGTRAFGDQFSTLDFQASYALNPHLTLFLEGTNLLAREQTFSMKTATGTTPYPQTWISGDRRIAVGARLNF